MKVEYSNVPINTASYKKRRYNENFKKRKVDPSVVLVSIVAVFAAVRLGMSPYGRLADVVNNTESSYFQLSDSRISSMTDSASLLPGENVEPIDDYIYGEAVEAIKKTKYQYAVPLVGNITSRFAEREDPFGSEAIEYHKGIDISASESTSIKSYLDGTVEKVDYNSSYGNYLIIRHSEDMQTLYAHCEKIHVNEGDAVSCGDVIAKAGNTGRSTATHLHFEVRIDGVAVDPEDYLA